MKYVTNTWTVSNKIMRTIEIKVHSGINLITLSIDEDYNQRPVSSITLDLAQSYDLIEALTEARQLIFPRVKD